MNRTLGLILGVLLTITASLTGLTIVPNWQFRELKPYAADASTEQAHPVAYFGANQKGREVYTDLGCIYCHSQQVRAANYGADIDRGWGTRRSVRVTISSKARP